MLPRKSPSRPSLLPLKHDTSVTATPKKNPLRFLQYTGLFIGKSSGSNLFYLMRLSRSVFLTLGSILLFLIIFFHTVFESKFTMKYASYHLACNWFLQACLNVLLIQHWQRSARWNKDMSDIFYSHYTGHIFKKYAILMLPLCVLILAFLFCLLVATHVSDDVSVIFNFGHIFGFKFMVIAGRLMSWYTGLVFLITNFYFAAASGVVYTELHEFNKRLENEFSPTKLANNNRDLDMFTTLHSFYIEHLTISNKIRALDRSLGIFAFSTAVTTIPATVFTLWTFIVRLQSSWLHVLITVIELFLCGIVLMFLVVNPARIREELRTTRALIFSSLPLWETYESKIYDISRLFVAHLDQDDLGVSIWGFVMITKHFILSVVSITLTFLVFVLETQNGSKTLVAHRAMGKFKP